MLLKSFIVIDWKKKRNSKESDFQYKKKFRIANMTILFIVFATILVAVNARSPYAGSRPGNGYKNGYLVSGANNLNAAGNGDSSLAYNQAIGSQTYNDNRFGIPPSVGSSPGQAQQGILYPINITPQQKLAMEIQFTQQRLDSLLDQRRQTEYQQGQSIQPNLQAFNRQFQRNF